MAAIDKCKINNMCKQLLCNIAFVLVLGLIASGFSAKNSDESSMVAESTTCKCKDANQGRIVVNGDWNFYLSANFLYWVAEEDGLDVGANQKNPGTSNPRPHSLEYYHMNFDYHPGFQVSFGMNCGKRSDWILQAEYTRLHTENHGAGSVPAIWFNDIQPNFLSPEINLVPGTAIGYSFLKTAGKWKNHIDLVDLDLRRSFQPNKQLVLTPLFGLRSGVLNQRYHGNYLATYIADTSRLYTLSSIAKQQSWLIGPKAGLLTDWLLGAGCKIFGNIDFSLFYQHFKDSFRDFDSVGVCSITSGKLNRLTPNLRVGLGFGYGTYFANHNSHFNFTIGYDFQIFWNQNYMSTLVFNKMIAAAGPVYFNGAKPADLLIHGLTTSVRFDF